MGFCHIFKKKGNLMIFTGMITSGANKDTVHPVRHPSAMPPHPEAHHAARAMSSISFISLMSMLHPLEISPMCLAVQTYNNRVKSYHALCPGSSGPLGALRQ